MIKRIVIFFCFFILTTKTSIAPSITFNIYALNVASAQAEVRRLAYMKEFSLFRQAIGQRESGNRYDAINDYGCLGAFQFQVETLNRLGITGITAESFRKDPSLFPESLQNEALLMLVHANAQLLHQFDRYIGRSIQGVVITRSGLLAAMHLGGIRGIQAFFYNKNPSDAYGTTIKDYLILFSGYNI